MPATSRDLPPHHTTSTSTQASTSHSQLTMDPSSTSSQTPHLAPAELEPRDEEIFDGGDENTFRDMTLDEVLEDLNARFLVNLPKEEMNIVRVYWQAEQAHWFYEDYIRPLNPLLPSLSQKHFTHLIIASSPLYSGLTSEGDGIDYDAIWIEYCEYKKMVPVCGGILINRAGDKALMVRGWKSGSGWCFPRGKINSGESEPACAIREVEEEVGFDMTNLVIPTDKIQTQINAQLVTMFIVGGVDEETEFVTQTRHEIGAIEWVNLTDLPTWTGKRGPRTTGGKGSKKFFNVTPFIGPLKRWLADKGYKQQPPKGKGKGKKQDPKQSQASQSHLRDLQPFQFDELSAATPATSWGQHPTAISTSALDNLFTKFVGVQQEQLETDKPVGGQSTKDGLERLFGNLVSVTKPQKQLFTAPPVGSDPPAETEAARLQKEDDALARLLCGLATPSPKTPAPQPRAPGNARLLALLNQKPLSSVSTPNDQHLANSSTAQDISTPTASQPPVRPHHASVLAVLTLSAQSAQPVKGEQDSASHEVPWSPHLDPVMSVLETSVSAAPGPADEAERRRRRQAALLEMTLAGLDLKRSNVIDQSSSSNAHTGTENSDWRYRMDDGNRPSSSTTTSSRNSRQEANPRNGRVNSTSGDRSLSLLAQSYSNTPDSSTKLNSQYQQSPHSQEGGQSGAIPPQASSLLQDRNIQQHDRQSSSSSSPSKPASTAAYIALNGKGNTPDTVNYQNRPFPFDQSPYAPPPPLPSHAPPMPPYGPYGHGLASFQGGGPINGGQPGFGPNGNIPLRANQHITSGVSNASNSQPSLPPPFPISQAPFTINPLQSINGGQPGFPPQIGYMPDLPHLPPNLPPNQFQPAHHYSSGGPPFQSRHMQQQQQQYQYHHPNHPPPPHLPPPPPNAHMPQFSDVQAKVRDLAEVQLGIQLQSTQPQLKQGSPDYGLMMAREGVMMAKTGSGGSSGSGARNVPGSGSGPVSTTGPGGYAGQQSAINANAAHPYPYSNTHHNHNHNIPSKSRDPVQSGYARQQSNNRPNQFQAPPGAFPQHHQGPFPIQPHSHVSPQLQRQPQAQAQPQTHIGRGGPGNAIHQNQNQSQSQSQNQNQNQMHQPIPRNGPQAGLLAMLNGGGLGTSGN